MFVETEKFSDISLDPIPIGCRSNLFLDDDAEPVNSTLVSLKKEDEILRAFSFPGFHRLSEILRVGNPLPL